MGNQVSMVPSTKSSSLSYSRRHALALQLHPRHARPSTPPVKAHSGSAPFDYLPDELVVLIFTHLPGDDLARVSCIDHRFARLANDDDELWLGALRRDFGAAFAPPPDVHVPKGDGKLQYATCRETFRAIVRGRLGGDGQIPSNDVRVGMRVFG
jgi:hypothetical protein